MARDELGFTSGGVNYTPVRAPRGQLVHAVLIESSHTACGMACSGLVVTPKIVDCPTCQRLLEPHPCGPRPRKRRKRRRRRRGD